MSLAFLEILLKPSLIILLFLGSSHSDKEVDPNTPEKLPRPASERKRKRKIADDPGTTAVLGSVGGPPASKARPVIGAENKKINDYFSKHHIGSSPVRHGGAKSPSPQQAYPMVSEQKVRSFLMILYYFYLFLTIISG